MKRLRLRATKRVKRESRAQSESFCQNAGRGRKETMSKARVARGYTASGGENAVGGRESTRRVQPSHEYYAQTRDWSSLPARSCSQANKPSQLLCKRVSMQMLTLQGAPLRRRREGRPGNNVLASEREMERRRRGEKSRTNVVKFSRGKANREYRSTSLARRLPNPRRN